MKHVFMTLLMAIFFVVNSSAQIRFTNESGSHPINDEKLEKSINKYFKTPINNDLEFRLYTLPQLSRRSSVFVMRLKNNDWEARFFRKDKEGDWSVEEVNNSGLDSLWVKLTKNNVLTLPNQESIREQMRIYKADSTAVLEDSKYAEMDVRDGVVYHFELLQYRNYKRAYSYHCPYVYLQRYCNIEELYNAYAIIILVYKHLGIPLSVC